MLERDKSCFRSGFYQFGSKTSFCIFPISLNLGFANGTMLKKSYRTVGRDGSKFGIFLTGISVSLVGEFVGLDVCCTGCARVCLDSAAVLSFYQAVDDS